MEIGHSLKFRLRTIIKKNRTILSRRIVRHFYLAPLHITCHEYSNLGAYSLFSLFLSIEPAFALLCFSYIFHIVNVYVFYQIDALSAIGKTLILLFEKPDFQFRKTLL